MKRLLILCVTICLLALPLRAGDHPVTVHAAASLKTVLQEALRSYDDPVVVAVAGSGAIARQVVAGVPADLVILASPVWMDWVEAQGIAAASPRIDLAANRLVVIGPAGAAPLTGPEALPTRLAGGRLAMGHREAVPAGVYARQWLQHAGLWTSLRDDLAETDNVRAALALVLRKQAPLGVVYASDVVGTPGVDVLYHIPENSHDPIRYPALALSARGQKVLAHLRASGAVLAAQGFLPVTP